MTTAPFITDFDLHLLGEGKHYRAYEKLGAHPCSLDGDTGVHFAVQAPNAERISVIGDFNGWDANAHPLSPRAGSGLWTRFVPGVAEGALYKYRIQSRHQGHWADKADPYGFAAEIRPQTASKVWDLSKYQWRDQAWMATRHRRNAHDAPISIYEVHAGSWRRVPEERNRWLTYRELAPELVGYLTDVGFTHVEFLPLTEHPLDGSWGYQTVGYYAPTSRYGSPDDFMFLIDTLHQAGIGVILDWVPAHFPSDAHGLAYFDGTHLYEHEDPRQREHPEWGTRVFNYGRWEVQNFLISNARFWFDRYHIDGFRVDAVASMLYLDYGHRDGDWVPNQYGGRENVDAIAFLRRFNEWAYHEFPDVMTMAEESTTWPMVSRPTYVGGLGFGFKWNMGWMHDMLQYASCDPVFRSYHHNRITFSLLYAFSENYVLPFSHDEVVHGKGSMIGKMPGDDWQKFATLRSLYGYMFTHPGKKLLFMGNEIGQRREWDVGSSLDWDLMNQPLHRGLQHWVRDLNAFLRGSPALYEADFDPRGFEWIDCSDAQQSVVCFLRYGRCSDDPVLVVCNFTPVVRHEYVVGVPFGGYWRERLNSDAPLYGGSGQGNLGGVHAESAPAHGRAHSLTLTLPPLSIVAFQRIADERHAA